MSNPGKPSLGKLLYIILLDKQNFIQSSSQQLLVDTLMTAAGMQGSGSCLSAPGGSRIEPANLRYRDDLSTPEPLKWLGLDYAVGGGPAGLCNVVMFKSD